MTEFFAPPNYPRGPQSRSAIGSGGIPARTSSTEWDYDGRPIRADVLRLASLHRVCRDALDVYARATNGELVVLPKRAFEPAGLAIVRRRLIVNVVRLRKRVTDDREIVAVERQLSAAEWRDVHAALLLRSPAELCTLGLSIAVGVGCAAVGLRAGEIGNGDVSLLMMIPCAYPASRRCISRFELVSEHALESRTWVSFEGFLRVKNGVAFVSYDRRMIVMATDGFDESELRVLQERLGRSLPEVTSI